MPNYYYDLHMHSCLSPCADDEMTPNNIVHMAQLNGLDILAVTDHNTCKNCPAVLQVANECGILAVPGMEICTSEEVHCVCLFATLDGAMAFDRLVWDALPDIDNDTAIFGDQWIMDGNDQLCGTEKKLLINACSLRIDQLVSVTGNYGGVCIPAHIDKNANSVLANLGFFPPDCGFASFEIADPSHLERLLPNNPCLDGLLTMVDSDAHYLWDIHGKDHSIELCERSAAALLNALKGCR